MTRREPVDPDDPRRRAPPAAIGDLLGELRERRGWAKRLEGARVHEEWPTIAGPQIALHTEPVRLHGGVLVVRVDSPAWATEVRYLSEALRARANEVLGGEQVERVVLVTGPLGSSRSDR
jgi:predicted nucleic acid-binding Zn ribbon protein